MVASGGHVPLLPPLGSGTECRGFMTLIVTSLREIFDIRNRERVCLLEVIMKATLPI